MIRAAEPRFAPFALERWFAALPRTWTVDLSPSGAMPLALHELLALASEEERTAFAASSLGYGPADGSEALRALVAQRYAYVGPGDVVVTCGAIEALQLAVSALVAPGDEVVVQRPMYPAVAGIAHALGARTVPWELTDGRGDAADLASLERLLTPATRVVAIAQPNNPTGSLLGRDGLAGLGELLSSARVWLVSDEVYRDLALEPGLALASAVDRYDRAISIGDVAKPFGLGGLRIGWLAARDEDALAWIRARRDYTTLSPPTLSDALARVALRNAPELLRRPLAHGRANLRALAALSARSDAVSVVLPRAGLSAFPRMRGAAVIQRRLADAGVLVVPGELFGRPDHLRIWLGGPPAPFGHVLEQIELLVANGP